MSWCDTKAMKKWCEAEIQDYYDLNPNLIIADYAKQLGMSITVLKQILQ